MCEWMTVVTAEDNFDGTEGVVREAGQASYQWNKL